MRINFIENAIWLKVQLNWKDRDQGKIIISFIDQRKKGENKYKAVSAAGTFT